VDHKRSRVKLLRTALFLTYPSRDGVRELPVFTSRDYVLGNIHPDDGKDRLRELDQSVMLSMCPEGPNALRSLRFDTQRGLGLAWNSLKLNF
jgi:hypothetical protein